MVPKSCMILHEKLADIMFDEWPKSNKRRDTVGSAGIQLFVHLYGGKLTDSLNSLRYAKFIEMASCGKTLESERLPPTETAEFFHSLRVYHQLIVWKDLSSEVLDPLQWGWKLDGTILMPIMTDSVPAPDNILKFIRCRYKVSSKNSCATNACSCHKNGLKCVPACGDCRGETCNNSEQIIVDQKTQESDEDMMNDLL